MSTAAEQVTAGVVTHLPDLKRFAMSLTRDRSQALDLVQDTVERALVKAHQFQADTRVMAWLTMIMRNLFLDGRRRAKMRATQWLDAPGMDQVLPHAADNPETRAVANEVVRAIQSIPYGDIELAMLAADGASYEQLSNDFQIPISTVRSRLFRSRAQMRVLAEGGAYLSNLVTEDLS